jgi:hypothetical protein
MVGGAWFVNGVCTLAQCNARVQEYCAALIYGIHNRMQSIKILISILERVSQAVRIVKLR